MMAYRFFLVFAIGIFFNNAICAQTEAQIKSRKIRAVVSQSTELKDGVLSTRTECEWYDRKGNILERKIFNNDSICSSWKKFSYNRKGLIVADLTLNPTSGDVKSTREFFYNRFDDEILSTLKNSTGVEEERIVTSYDADGKKTLITKYETGEKLVSRTSFIYDNKGMMISRITRNSKDEVISEKSIKYTY